MRAKVRIHELAKELGMTSAEVLALCWRSSVRAKGPSSSLNATYADAIRRAAVEQALTRPTQPGEVEITGPSMSVIDLASSLQRPAPEVLDRSEQLGIRFGVNSARLGVDDAERVRQSFRNEPQERRGQTVPSPEAVATTTAESASSFDLMSTDAVCAVVGLGVRVGEQYGRLESSDATGVTIALPSTTRRIVYGSHLTTEGGRAGPVQQHRANDPTAEAILIEDRSRAIGEQLIGGWWARDAGSREAIAIVAELLDPITADGVLELLPGLDDREVDVASAIANCARIGPEALPVPTPADLLTVAGSIDWVAFGLAQAVDRVRLAELAATGLDPTQLTTWVDAEESPAVVREWVDAGFPTPDAARDWTVHGFTPDEAAGWARLELRPEECLPWREAGWNAATAQGWVGAGFRLPDEALGWSTYGVPPDAVADWLAIGIAVPRLVGALVRHGVPPEEAVDLLAAGVPIATAARWMLSDIPRDGTTWARRMDWIAAEVGPADAWTWEDIPFESAVHLRRLEASPKAVRSWERRGLNAADAVKLLDNDIAAPQLEQWVRARIPAPAIPKWRLFEFSPREAGAWSEVGFNQPATASRIRDGFSRGEVESLLGNGIQLDEIVSWSAHSARTSSDSRLAEMLDSPRRVARWRNTGPPVAEWPDWVPVMATSPVAAGLLHNRGVKPAEVERLIGSGRLRRRQLTAWLETGLTLSEICSAQERGDSPDEYVEEALPDFAQWAKLGSHWIKSAGLTRRTEVGLQFLHDQGLRWADPSKFLFSTHPRPEWLEEVLARAENLSPSLSKQLAWPAVFESERATIVLFESSAGMTAWVGRNGTGLLASFDPSTFNLTIADDDPDTELAVGLAISWFIDCCITLPRSGGTHPEFSRETPNTANRRSPARQVEIVYRPQPSFRRRTAKMAGSSNSILRAHRVTGFIRRLPDGWTPTDEARNRAPAYLRRRMGPRDTFVRDHVRGHEERKRELIVRLSRYSSLGDALGTLPR